MAIVNGKLSQLFIRYATPESFQQPLSPARRQGIDFQCLLQKPGVLKVVIGDQVKHIRDTDPVHIRINQLKMVALTNLAFFHNSEVKTCAPAGKEPVGHIVAPKFDSELITGQARLSKHQDRCSYS